MFFYPGKGIDSHDSHIWLRLSVVHEIKVHKFLQLQIIGLHTIDDIRKQSTINQIKSNYKKGLKLADINNLSIRFICITLLCIII